MSSNRSISPPDSPKLGHCPLERTIESEFPILRCSKHLPSNNPLGFKRACLKLGDVLSSNVLSLEAETPRRVGATFAQHYAIVRKISAIAESVTNAPGSAHDRTAILILDHVPARREVISRIYEDEFEVFACQNLWEACATVGQRNFLAIFVAWKSSGPQVLHFAAARTHKVIVICETESELWSASEFRRTVFPEVTLEVLHSASGRLNVGAVLQKLDLPAQRSEIPISAGTGTAMAGNDRIGLILDVFLSVKREDYPRAQGLYSFLTECGLKVFFAPESLPQLANSKYNQEIERALDQARHMVVMTSSPKYLSGTYVEFEWRSFHNELIARRKSGNLLILTSCDFSVGELPLGLRGYEVMPFDEESFDKVLPYLR